ncbi:hypothetical protein Fot_13856 [Forsythia ovata]|uniref:Uncharacterized protein n=1 Tax=Forsythia ovata TaxID=205694 RepID=A0ABD1W766_9LAMI
MTDDKTKLTLPCLAKKHHAAAPALLCFCLKEMNQGYSHKNLLLGPDYNLPRFLFMNLFLGLTCCSMHVTEASIFFLIQQHSDTIRRIRSLCTLFSLHGNPIAIFHHNLIKAQ